jgi:uncharacterized flavoprotein (TIGR03862 family)
MSSLPVIICGSGPAGLMAAHVLARAGQPVEIFERRPGPGWKLLVAGSSGLNVTHEAPDLAPFYPTRREEIARLLARFGKDEWLAFLKELGEETYVGTSRRYFVKSFTASNLLKGWTGHLAKRGVKFHYGKEFASLEGRSVRFTDGTAAEGSAVVLALGGPSWEESPSPWPAWFRAAGYGFEEFAPSNAGWSFRAPEGFFARAEGKPIKGLTLQTRLGEKTGELMITRYGLEGTPIYTLGVPGIARADLKPDLAEAKLAARLQPFRGGPAEKIRGSKVSEGAFLFFEALAPASAWDSPAALAHALKNLEVELLAPRSLKECISARGGLRFEEVNEDLQLRRAPGVFCAGEMLDWDAPTGGFLLQASVSSGFVAGDAARRFVAPN